MSLSQSSLQGIPLCYASCSIGCRPEDTLPKKLDAIASVGLQAIELSMPDLLSFACLHLRVNVGPYDYDDLCSAAKVVKTMCDAKSLKILILQPFANFEGWKEGSEERKDAFKRVRGWIEIMKACGTEMLQVDCLLVHSPKYLCSNLSTRSALQIPQQRRLALTELVSSMISESSPTCLRRTTFGSHTRTGAGLRMHLIGRTYGRLYKRSTGRTLASV